MLRSFASNPALRSRMQRAASNPSLRATATAASSIVPQMPTGFAPSRTLVSTVLLTRDVYESNKVNELKHELKSRGLSTTGKRNELIKRLLDNDQQRASVLTPSASEARPATKANKSAGNARSASSTSKPRSTASTTEKIKKSSIAPDPSESAAGVDGQGATVSHPPNMETGQVSANFIDPSAGGIVQPTKLEAHATAPGVPPAKTAKAPITFEVIIPYEKEPAELGPDIPLMTSYFHPESSHYSGHRSPEDGPVAHTPKVRTVSGEETYPGGGVSHHQPIFDEADLAEGHASSTSGAEDNARTFGSTVKSMFSGISQELGLSEEATKKTSDVSKSASNLLKEARESITGATRAATPSIATYSTSAAASSSGGNDSYSGGNTRPLTDSERTGLFTLGGIVIGGYLLGGLGKQSKRKEARVQQSIQEQVRQLEASHREREERELAQVVQRAEAALRA